MARLRHCYNQLLEHFSKKENTFSLKAAYNFYKNTIREQFEWYQEVSFHVSANAIQNLHNAFSHFFRRVKKGEKKEKDSNRRARAKLQIQKLHFRIAKQRAAIAHQLSNYLFQMWSKERQFDVSRQNFQL